MTTSTRRGRRHILGALALATTVLSTTVLSTSAASGGAPKSSASCDRPEIEMTAGDDEIEIWDGVVVVLVNDKVVRRIPLDTTRPAIVVHTGEGDDQIDIEARTRLVLVCTGSGRDVVSARTPSAGVTVRAEGSLRTFLGASLVGHAVEVVGDAIISTTSVATIWVGGDATITTYGTSARLKVRVENDATVRAVTATDHRIEVIGTADIVTGDGDDVIVLGGGDDRVEARAGDDWIVSGGGVDHVDGGPGWDNCDRNVTGTNPAVADLGPNDTYLNCELLDGPVDVDPGGPRLPPGHRPNRPLTLNG